MRQQSLMEQSWKGRRVRVAAVHASQQDSRIRDTVAQRAFRIFESRKGARGNPLEDWQRAECEIVRPLGCGFVVLDDKISLNTDISVFEEGPIEVCPEPRRLVICGKVPAIPGESGPRPNDSSSNNLYFRVMDLPVEIDPSQTRIGFNGRILQIDLARTTHDVVPRANAA